MTAEDRADLRAALNRQHPTIRLLDALEAAERQNATLTARVALLDRLAAAVQEERGQKRVYAVAQTFMGWGPQSLEVMASFSQVRDESGSAIQAAHEAICRALAALEDGVGAS